MVKKGNEVEIESHGKPVARLVSPLDTIEGDRLVQLLKAHGPDPETANALDAEIQKFRVSQREIPLD